MSNNGKASEEKLQGNGMLRVAAFIVDRRNLFFLLFALGIIFSLIASNWVKVEDSLSAYLPKTTETSRGLDRMEEQFITYGTANVMVANLTYDEAVALQEEIEALDDVAMVQFDNTTRHYNDFSALYSVTFDYGENDEKCLEALDNLKTFLSGYDAYVSTTLGNQSSETIAKEMSVITVYVAVIVVSVLIFTSDSYAEVPVLIMTFLASAALAKGSNYLLGTISFVSNSVAIVLQLALSVDYAIIFCNRYKDERRSMDARSADIVALSKAIPEIFSSSLTTVGGLIAMCFMQFGIGPDLAIVLIKAIILSLMSVFLLMPGLIMLFADLMEKTKHKSFVPKIPFVGKFAWATRKVVPFLFVALIAVAFHFSNNCPYVYGYSKLTTPIQSEQDKIDQMIEDSFGKSNMVALIVPGNDYETEAELLAELESRPEVDYTMGLANTEAQKGRMLTERLNSREFADAMDVDPEVGKILYAAYAINDENYAKLISGFSEYRVPFIDMFLFLYQEVDEGYVTLDDDQMEQINDAYRQINVAKNQLQGEDYDRMLVYLTLPEEGDETFAFLDEMHTIAKKYYGKDADILIPGEATSQYDLCKTFSRDNSVVNVVSILAVLVVLLFTFKSVGMPILLIVVIQGCIWLNFSYPALANQPLFFMGYLIVSSIQMGANIDYAIVVSSRYMEKKGELGRKEAIIDAMNFAFPTIITSGSMMSLAGILIGMKTSEPCICGIGQCLGRGTIISIIAVLFVLPQILLLGDRIIEKTSFDVSLPLPVVSEHASGLMRVDGLVQGKVNGTVVGTMHAVIRGDVDVQVISNRGTVRKLDGNAKDDEERTEASHEE